MHGDATRASHDAGTRMKKVKESLDGIASQIANPEGERLEDGESAVQCFGAAVVRSR